MATPKVDYAIFRHAMRKWIAANHESFDVDYAAAYKSYVSSTRDMSWLEPHISEVVCEYQVQSFVPAIAGGCG